ncbi:MAG: histidine kinase [Treponemataceae bacterium]|nr:histidine kinase [Treponemataceae bacterium]
MELAAMKKKEKMTFSSLNMSRPRSAARKRPGLGGQRGARKRPGLGGQQTAPNLLGSEAPGLFQKPVHFRDEIRTSFISYAFIPAAALFVLITLCAGIIWSLGINRKARSDCEQICSVLEVAADNYMEKIREMNKLDIKRMKEDRAFVSETYSSLKEFLRKQLISANFVVIDNDFSVLLQGDSSQTFRIPSYQKEIDWGPLYRMSLNPGLPILEVSHEYSSGALDEVIAGCAIFNEGAVSGYLVFVMTGKSVQEALKSISSPYVVTNGYRDVFVTTNPYYLDDMNRLSSLYRTEPGEVSVSGSNAVFRRDICGDSLSVYTIIDVSQMKKAITTLILLAVVLLVFLSVAMFVSGDRIAADKTRTIDELVRAFHDVEDGNLENRVNIQGNIEFQTIGEAYNKMLDDIKRLIAENEKETRAKYISELKQLEMQFNPHFLYNTLATVRYLVKLDPDGAVKTVVSLAELLRYSLSSDSSYVELGGDLKYIENYLAILATRFGKKFGFDISVSDDCRRAVIPKLIVQPVIENAVKYGFEGVSSMKISVSAQKDEDFLLLTIADTGSGMDQETLSTVKALLSTPENATNHIGLFNVQRRIKLLYGEEYGLSVESEAGRGTVVRVRLPYRCENVSL